MKALWLAVCLLGGMAEAQVLIRVQQDGGIVQVPNNSTYAANSVGAGQAAYMWVTLTYTGSTTLSFLKPPQLLGSPQFTISVRPPAVTVLAPNESVSLQLRYLPVDGNRVQAELDYGTSETATAAPSKAGLVVLGLTGTAPEYSLGYSLASDGNVSGVESGGTIAFPETLTNGSSVANVQIVNRGSGSGRVTSVLVSGEGFAPGLLPLLPAQIASLSNLPFVLRFQPLRTGAASGALRVRFENGLEYVVALSGSAVVSRFSYQVVAAGADPVNVVPKQMINLPAVKLGEKTTAMVRFTNTGPVEVDLVTITVSGAAYVLSELPSLPARVQPGETYSFVLTFTPKDPARNTGVLRVGDDVFDLTGDGLGAKLEYRYGSGTAVLTGGVVPFPGTPLGQSSTVSFQLSNSGTAPVSITSLGVSGEAKTAFSVVNPPGLPFTVAAGGTTAVTLRYAPLSPGATTAVLRIEGDSFTLTGTTNAPTGLPEYTVSGPATVLAFDQPSLGVTLQAPYPVALSGTLVLSVETDGYAADPAIQFSSGGRSANFTIAAGATRAVFGNGQNEIRFQAGTVAGAIIATPTFATQSGYGLTPDAPKSLRMTLAPVAPRLVSLQSTNVSASGFTLIANGIATTRTMARADVKFVMKPGFTVSQTDFVLDLTNSAYNWFQSTSSAGYGGQFSVQVPFTLSNSDTATTAATAISAIDSVSFTVTNERGVSNSLSVKW